MRKILSLILTLLMIMSVASIPDSIVLAATTTTYTYENYTYTVISSLKKTARITKYSGKDENVVIPEKMNDIYTVTEIDSNCFTSTLTKSVNISKYVESIAPLAFSCDFLSAINVDDENKFFSSRDGVLYSKDMKMLVRFPVAYGKENFSIPHGVEKIGEYAFRGPVSSSNAPSDLKLSFSDSITEICSRAFYDSYIREIKLPESVVTIGSSAFLNAKVTYLYIGANVREMGNDLFCTCSGTTYSPLKTIYVSEENEIFSSKDNVLFGNYGRDLIFYPRTKENKNYIVPDSVTTIKECAFSFLSMECIDLNNVDKLESNAFFNVSINKYIISEELNKFYITENNMSFEIVSLNPDCTISFHTYSSTKYNVKIYGYIGSTAESFVNEKNSDLIKLTFVSIDGENADSYRLAKPVSFGSYPQRRVVSETLVEKLNNLDFEWISYGYYSGTGKMDSGEKSDYMKFADVEYEGNRYRGVTFSQYRPLRGYLSSGENYSYQDDNGYFTDTVYWFKYEPIEWKVLDKATGFVVSDMLLDAQSFCDTAYEYTNDYSQSSLRIWLNNSFYNTAFSDEEKNIINSFEPNDIDISDKICILSYSDALKTDFGFTSNVNETKTRYCTGSDYAQCQGLMVKTNTNVSNYYENNSPWLLRTAGTANDMICNVTVDGKVAQNHNIFNYDGIRPCICISTISGSGENTPCKHNDTKLVGQTDPSCSKGGYSGDLICVYCGQMVEAGTVISPRQHSYIVKDMVYSTCTECGRIIYSCSECANIETEQLELKEHSIVYDDEVMPTCTENGLSKGSHCSTCYKVISPQEIIEATGHTVVKDEKIEPTYKSTGLTQGSHCSVCKTIISEQTVIPALICVHNFTNTVVVKKATMSEDGNSKTLCTYCDRVISSGVTKAAKSITLSKTSMSYTGKVLQKPSVAIKDSNGNKIDSDNYSVSYISRSTGKSINSIKNIGQYKVKVNLKGKYSGTKYLYFTVKPKKNKIKSLSSSKTSITAKWNKDSSVTGYQLLIATDSKFTKNKKTVKAAKNSISSYKFKNLKKGKKYYVKIRPYRNVKVDGKSAVIYGEYSSVKSISCKKK